VPPEQALLAALGLMLFTTFIGWGIYAVWRWVTRRS
jgi:hypothetical protein